MSLSESALLSAGISAGLFDQAAVARARVAARQRRLSLLDAIAFEQRFPPAAFYHAAAQLRGLRFLQGHDATPDEDLMRRLPQGLMQRHHVVPVRVGGELMLLTDNPDDGAGLAAFRHAIGEEVPAAIAEPALVLALLNRQGGGQAQMHRSGDEADAVGLLDRLLTEAWLRRASDVHVEPLERVARVRLRVDGGMQELGARYSPTQAAAIVSRVKVLAGMDIAETRAPQDGGFVYQLKGWDTPPLDLRAATLPALHGERATLRMLGDAENRLGLDRLGMSPAQLTRLRSALERPYGIILVTGPTGSGKSTTLYGALRELDAERLNILTVEDPIEQPVPGLSQSATSQKLSFAAAVRAFLRHDPDVIMIGEVRDGETADAAVKAAMTGHLVLTTLHTNHAVAAVTRLADIGCERFLIAANLAGVIAQRLARRLCQACRRERPATAEEQHLLGSADPVSVYEAAGCAVCLGTGYTGRIGIFETLWVDAELADAVQAGASERELAARARDLHTLRDDARDKVLAGLTSLAEVRHLL